MTKDEFQGWLAETKSNRNGWRRDECQIHNRHLVLWAYCGGVEQGNWVEITQNGGVSLGTYKDAFPHVGEAVFRIYWTHQYPTVAEAIASLTGSGGLGGLRSLLA